MIGLPELSGSPIRVSILPELTASRGRLLSGSPTRGIAVHAASFIRCRQIVLESRLLRSRRLFRLILLHEVFHFVWTRLGNTARSSFSKLLEDEFAAGARGELGESALVKKEHSPIPGTRLWRDYLCESFCDTAAFMYSGFKTHPAFTLRNRWISRRRSWFAATFAACRRC